MKIFLILSTLSAFLLPADYMLLQAQALTTQEAMPSESVQVLLSEEVVASGESLWFQAYLSGTQAEQTSKVLYVEILNSQNAVLQGIYSIKNGKSRGQIELPDTLSGGWYQIRAYTQEMRNFGEASFWSQGIMVINPYEDKLIVPQPVVSRQNASIQFFPEGGNYVEGIPNHVLVQLPTAISSDVIGAAKLISLHDSVLLAEVPFQEGQGLLSITPESGKEYALEMYLSDEAGQDSLREALPKPQQQGASLQAQFDQVGLQLNTYHSQKGAYTIQIRGESDWLYRQAYQNHSFSFNMADEDMPEGILELSVLDEGGEVLAQRLLYHPATRTEARISLNKSTYLPREQIAANISVAGTTRPTQLAATVRKVNPLTAYLSQYKNTFGLIDQESLSLSNNEPESIARINQGLIAKESPFQPLDDKADEQGIRYSKEGEALTISGKVKGLNGKKVAGRVLVLSVPGTNPYFEYDFVNEDGSFQIPIKEDVLGNKDIILQMADTSIQVSWTLDNKFASENTYNHLALPAVPEQELQALQQYYSRKYQIKSQYDNFEVPDAEAGQTAKKFRFYGAPNFEVRLEDYIELPNFVEVNRELMPGIRLRETKEGYNLDVFDIPSRTFLPGEPSVFLDGVLVHDLSYIIDFPPREIAFIETVNRRTYYGEYRFDGAIAIYSQGGNAYLPALSSSAKLEQVKLYTAYQAFTRPDSLPSHEPDFRTLLHWQPSLQLDSTPYRVTFHNADELGEFEILVEGITEDGQKVYGRKTYTVSLNDLP